VSAAALLTDAAGTVHRPAGADARIACLVPSITELVCDLGLADRLVARTGFCIHPWDTVRHVPKVGGTKEVRLERLRAQAPTHVIVNVDENTRETAEALRELVEHVIVTHPLGPDDNLALYRLLGAIFGRVAEAEALCARWRAARRRLARIADGRPGEDVLYLIWRDPWMTVGPDTYIARMLALIGWRTLPRAADARYPEVDLAACAGQVDRVLLSSEPFHFTQVHRDEVAGLLDGVRVELVDGELISWYGSRAIAGLEYLAALAGSGAVA
jgi:ABC-type Fe3+-hydroxamate transport system substrate-binding protein